MLLSYLAIQNHTPLEKSEAGTGKTCMYLKIHTNTHAHTYTHRCVHRSLSQSVLVDGGFFNYEIKKRK